MPGPGKASVLINKASGYFQLIGITQLRAVLISHSGGEAKLNE